jgi:DivIVA domain-containing protein
MAHVDLDRQAIERRDFPIARRGYDPSAVDAHLRALAAEMDQLGRRGAHAEASLASSAGGQVQSILQAAERAAADIEREAQERAGSLREQAEGDARRTREEAIAKARGYLADVAGASDALQRRVSAIDGEVNALLDSVRESAERVAGELAALDADIAALYDAASASAPSAAPHAQPHAVPPRPPPRRAGASAAPAKRPRARPARETAEPAAEAAPAGPPQPHAAPAASGPKAPDGDLDGARLVALNMALSGEPREATERYLAENFQLSERAALIDEVYAAIEA